MAFFPSGYPVASVPVTARKRQVKRQFGVRDARGIVPSYGTRTILVSHAAMTKKALSQQRVHLPLNAAEDIQDSRKHAGTDYRGQRLCGDLRSDPGAAMNRPQSSSADPRRLQFLLIVFKIATLYSPLRLLVPTGFGFFLLRAGYYGYTFVIQGRFNSMSPLLPALRRLSAVEV